MYLTWSSQGHLWNLPSFYPMKKAEAVGKADVASPGQACRRSRRVLQTGLAGFLLGGTADLFSPALSKISSL